MPSEVEFEIRTPTDDAGLVRNVEHALSLGLPEIVTGPHRSQRLKIIANGPTARSAPLGGPTLALNGALRSCLSRGVAPAWWAACDPQPLVADFLAEAPEATTYLVASKCDPAVFRALKGRNVLLWHIDDFATWDLVKDRNPVSTAVSITICAFELGERLGFSRFETWGWDGCYIDGLDHASPQAHRATDIENEVGDQVFSTTTSWALEAQDAYHKFSLTPRDVEIRGPGMIGAILRYLDAPTRGSAHGQHAQAS